MKHYCLWLFLVLGVVSTTYAQPPKQKKPTEVIGDTLPVLVPFTDTVNLTHISSQSPRFSPALKTTGTLLAGTAVWVATYAWVDEPLQKFIQGHKTKPVDAVAGVVEPLGRQNFLLPATGGVAIAGFALRNPNLRKVGTVAFGSLLLSGGVTVLIKNQVHRYRPSNTNENHFYDWGAEHSENTSFPSSHTTVAFAVATSVASVYGDKHRFVPPLAYGMATLVGLSRINDNAHWATDVMAGAAVGYLSAKASLFLYNKSEKYLNGRKGKVMVIPLFEQTSSSLYFVFSF